MEYFENVVEVSKLLEGKLYPIVSTVIPFLGMIKEEFEELAQRKDEYEPAQEYIHDLLRHLYRLDRFTNGYRETDPFNLLKLLYPRIMK